MRTVRQDENGIVLRLFAVESDASKMADIIARGTLDRYKVTQHISGNGWLVEDKETGRLLDADGPI